MKYKRFDKDYLIENLTYGDRLELGNLFREKREETEYLIEAYKIVKEKEPNLVDLALFIDREFPVLLEVLKYYIEAENALLGNSYSQEEMEAGVDRLTNPYHTAVSIAKDFGCFPYEVLNRTYSEILMILHCQKEQREFEKRYQKVLERKK